MQNSNLSRPSRFASAPFAVARAGLLALTLCLIAAATLAGHPLAHAATAAHTEGAPAQASAKDSTSTPAATTTPASPVAADADSDESDGNKPAPATKRGKHRSHIQIGDEEFDSFADAMKVAPWIVGVVFLVLGSIFLTPILVAIGIIWYKLRKTRMQNDAMLKLAEKGVVPTAQAVDAISSGAMPAYTAAPASSGAVDPPASSAAAASPAYQQVVAGRRRVVWSDLRRGVIMIAVGLAFCFYSIVDSGEPNWIGLVLLFLGLGYIAIWWLEDRHLQARQGGSAEITGGKVS